MSSLWTIAKNFKEDPPTYDDIEFYKNNPIKWKRVLRRFRRNTVGYNIYEKNKTLFTVLDADYAIKINDMSWILFAYMQIINYDIIVGYDTPDEENWTY